MVVSSPSAFLQLQNKSREKLVAIVTLTTLAVVMIFVFHVLF